MTKADPSGSSAAAQPPALRVLFLAAEVAPFAKTGGLADVAGALPGPLAEGGVDVRVCLPRYGRVEPARFGFEPALPPFEIEIAGVTRAVRVLRGSIGGRVPVYLIDDDHYFNRPDIYGYSDDGERFVFFCQAALELVRRLDWQPQVVHCHDWHTGIVPNWLATRYQNDAFFGRTASLYTIHNLQYQGIFGYRVLEVAGVAEHGFLHHPQIQQLDEVVDLMARGILFADVVTTVSPTYAREILTPEHGEELDPILRERRDRLHGILNGIDYAELDPARDRHLAAPFDVRTLSRRQENKLALQRRAGLPERPDVPLVGMVSRLADQKGFDLLAEIYEPALRALGLQIVILGTGDQRYHDLLQQLSDLFPEQSHAFFTFSHELAQQIYGGSDLFLMPSRFEPCGLGQMIAMRYGSIPVVRRTGGLADTVVDLDPGTDTGTGFIFDRYDRWELFGALVRAVECYRRPLAWSGLQRRAMAQRFTWYDPAVRYVELYHAAIRYRLEATSGPTS
ncbi:MAG: glycogen synthase [Chloroflexi bacterium]|nr:glycogen synthase [Chloroflexota bacterium]